MTPRAATHSGCPGRPALPCLSPAPQGTGNDWKNLPGTAQFLSTQTDTTMLVLIYKIGCRWNIRCPNFTPLHLQSHLGLFMGRRLFGEMLISSIPLEPSGCS